MNYNDLLTQSKAILKNSPVYISGSVSTSVFLTGAKWMHKLLNETSHTKTVFNDKINYNAYGIFKYSVCTVAFIITAIMFYRVHILLMPLSVFVFYFFEVQFLFLFPLLIDNVKKPLLKSLQQTWRIGIWKAMGVVIPISIFMIFGLFNTRAPLHNWHIGSLAIIIWYQHEVRNRL